MLDRLESLENRYETLTRELMDPQVQGHAALFQEKAKAQAELEEVVHLFRDYKSVLSHLKQAEELSSTEKDPEMLSMAKAEREELALKRASLEAELRRALLPKDPYDLK